MDDRGLIGLIFAILGGIIAILLIVAGVMYANDYEMRATVTDTHCDPAGSSVDVQTKLMSIDHTVKDVPYEQCQAMHAGNFVEYRIRTGRTTIYAVEGGQCLFDSETGAGCGEANIL